MDTFPQPSKSSYRKLPARPASRSGIDTVLSHRARGHTTFNASDLTAARLVSQPPRLVPPRSKFPSRSSCTGNGSNDDVPNILSSCLMTTEDLSLADNLTKVRLFDDSSENVRRTFSVHGYTRAVACSKPHGLVLTANSKSSSDFQSSLTIVRVTDDDFTIDQGVSCSIDWDAHIHDVAVTGHKTIAVAAKMIVYVMSIRNSDTVMPLIINAIPTFDIDALSIDFTPDGNHLAYIAEDGRLYLRDVRLSGLDSPAWTVQATKSVIDHTRIRVHVSASRPELYLASEEGLSAWDFRINRDYDPNRTFDGFEAPTSEWFYSSPLNSIFDVEESVSGLLAATGENSAVQLWDCRRAGLPLCTTHVPYPAQRVQFTNWTLASTTSPGLWVDTGRDVYMLRVGRYPQRG